MGRLRVRLARLGDAVPMSRGSSDAARLRAMRVLTVVVAACLGGLARPLGTHHAVSRAHRGPAPDRLRDQHDRGDAPPHPHGDQDQTRGHFPDVQVATKLIYLAIERAETKCGAPPAPGQPPAAPSRSTSETDSPTDMTTVAPASHTGDRTASAWQRCTCTSSATASARPPRQAMNAAFTARLPRRPWPRAALFPAATR
jgi:hypothetical protein